MSRSYIVFSGFNPRAVVAFLRTLEENHVNYGIIAKSEDDEIYLSDYGKRVVAVRSTPALDLGDFLRQIESAKKKLNADSYLIAPSTEALNRFLLQHREQFAAVNCEVPLVDKKMYENISDKKSFGEMCVKHRILVPAEYENLKTAGYPFVAKPRTYFSRQGETYPPVIIFDEKKRKEFVEKYQPDDFYYQEFIDGPSFYLLYYFHKNGGVTKFSQQNYIQQPEGKSVIAAVSSDYHHGPESLKYETLFKVLGFTGLVMVEVKKRDSKDYMIEANPRFWGPSQLLVDSKMNLFEALLYDQGLISKAPENTEPKAPLRYYWHGGYLEAMAHKEGVTFHHQYSAEQFEAEKTQWMAADIYNRNDTRGIYDREVSRFK